MDRDVTSQSLLSKATIPPVGPVSAARDAYRPNATEGMEATEALPQREARPRAPRWVDHAGMGSNRRLRVSMEEEYDPEVIARRCRLDGRRVRMVLDRTQELGIATEIFGDLAAPSLIDGLSSGATPLAVLELLEGDLALLARRLTSWEMIAYPGAPVHTAEEMSQVVDETHQVLTKRMTLTKYTEQLQKAGRSPSWPHAALLQTYPMGREAFFDWSPGERVIGDDMPAEDLQILQGVRDVVAQVKRDTVSEISKSVGRQLAGSWREWFLAYLSGCAAIRSQLTEIIVAERLLALEWVRRGLRDAAQFEDAGGVFAIGLVAIFHDEEREIGHYRKLRERVGFRPEGSAYVALTGSQRCAVEAGLDEFRERQPEHEKFITDSWAEMDRGLGIAAAAGCISTASPENIAPSIVTVIGNAVASARNVDPQGTAESQSSADPRLKRVTAPALLRALDLLRKTPGEYVSANLLQRAIGCSKVSEVPSCISRLRKYGYLIQAAQQQLRRMDPDAQFRSGYRLVR